MKLSDKMAETGCWRKQNNIYISRFAKFQSDPKGFIFKIDVALRLDLKMKL
jgi:hypothetical protein